MSTPAARRPLSVEDYLRLEEASEARHEYVAGRVYAMTGVSKRHNRIAINILRGLADAAEHESCRIYVSDVKLRAAEDVIYYPDLMVACGPDEGHPLIEDAPCLVVEVLSPSTEAIDRREKLAAYTRIPTLKAYVVVHQERRRVELHARDEAGDWYDAELVGGGRVPFPCPEAELSLDQIYDGTGVAE